MMKTTQRAIVCLAVLGTPVGATTLQEPVMEPAIVIEETERAGSSIASYMPRLIFILLAQLALAS